MSAAVPCERCRFQNMKNSPRAFAASAAVSAAGGRQPKKSAPSSQKGRSKERITFSIGPNPSRSMADRFQRGSGGANLTVLALSTPSGTVTSTASATKPSPPALVCTRAPQSPCSTRDTSRCSSTSEYAASPSTTRPNPSLTTAWSPVRVCSSSWSHHARETLPSDAAQPYSRFARCHCTARASSGDASDAATSPSSTSPREAPRPGTSSAGLATAAAAAGHGLSGVSARPSSRSISSSGSSCGTSHDA
mmetsp:Transcript_41369/g.133619  ORF Transcript_41369/g.133619 Transcript_41369/m.133619 type:complete len:249 (-) Transcript_41369:381-1127(-)